MSAILFVMAGVFVALLVVLVNYGMLHVVAGSSTVDHSTAANVASLAQGGGAVGLEANIQTRNQGAVPVLLGLDAVEDAALGDNYFQWRLNTWRSTDYNTIIPDRLTTAHGIRNPYANISSPMPMENNADIEAFYKSIGGNDHWFAWLLSYPPVIPPAGGQIITRRVTLTAADYSTTGAFGTASNITDLNPNKRYRVHGILGTGGTDCGIVRVTAPSMNGMCMQALVPEGLVGGYLFPYDSQIIEGTETVSVQASGGAASTVYAIVMFEEYGPAASAGGQAINTAGGGGGSIAPPKPPAGGGNTAGTGKVSPLLKVIKDTAGNIMGR